MMDETASFCLLALPVFMSGLALLEVLRSFETGFWRKTRLRGAAVSVLVFLFVGSTAFLIGECYYRFFYDTTDAFNYTKTSARWFARHYHRNPAIGGLRDTVGYDLEIAPSKRRVTLLGDSFTSGHGIEDIEDRFGNRLRHDHPEWEVQVVAEIGMNTTGETLNRSASWAIWRTFRSRLPAKISDTTPWLPISGRSDWARSWSFIRLRRIAGAEVFGKGIWMSSYASMERANVSARSARGWVSCCPISSRMSSSTATARSYSVLVCNGPKGICRRIRW